MAAASYGRPSQAVVTRQEVGRVRTVEKNPSDGRGDRSTRAHCPAHRGVQCDFNVMLNDPVNRPPVNPLDVLLEHERDAANSYLAYRRKPREHVHGIKV